MHGQTHKQNGWVLGYGRIYEDKFLEKEKIGDLVVN
jgi:hypothetical protein